MPSKASKAPRWKGRASRRTRSPTIGDVSLMRKIAAMEAQDDRRQLFEGFRSEASNRSSAGRFDRAAELYTKALDLFPDDVDCLVARSSCHFQNGHFDSCIEDANTALKLAPKIPKAEFMKAEAFYHKGEFEQSLICYHRANLIRPGAPQYARGIKKAEGAIENSIGKAMKGGMLSTAMSARIPKTVRRDVGSVPARKPDTRDATKHFSMKHPQKTVKKLLQELYGDWKYLEEILNDEDEILQEMNNESIKEKTKKKKGKKISTPGRADDDDDDDEGTAVHFDTNERERRKAKRGRSEDIKALVEKELVYLEDRTTFWVQQRSPASAVNSRPGPGGVSVSDIMTTIHEVQQAQIEGQFLETLRPAERALNKLKKSGESDISDRMKLMGTLHSLVGSAYYETGNLTSATKHHQHDLHIAERGTDLEAKSRALDNLARVHVRCEKYSSAIRCFSKKIPLIQLDLEAAWLYHEMGRCHLELEHYTKALSCAQKSLDAAKHTEDIGWQLNAQVLWAQTKVELGEFEEALRGFQDALSLAEDERDEEASFAIRKALIHVREKIKELEDKKVKKEELGQKEEEKKEEKGELKRGVRKIAFCESDPNSEEDESKVKEKYEEDWDEEEAEEEEEEEENTFHDVSDESSAAENQGGPTRSGDSTPTTQDSDPTELKDTDPIIVQNDSGSTSLSETGSIPDLQERPESFRESSRPESTRTMKRPQSSMSRSSRPRSTAPQSHLPQY